MRRRKGFREIRVFPPLKVSGRPGRVGRRLSGEYVRSTSPLRHMSPPNWNRGILSFSKCVSYDGLRVRSVSPHDGSYNARRWSALLLCSQFPVSLRCVG